MTGPIRMLLPRSQYAHPPGESPAYDMLLACSRCATCVTVCPTYAVTMLETASPRGRVQLIRALEEGRVEGTPRMREILRACLDCRACETVCPNGIQPGHLATRKRAELAAKLSLSRWLKRLILGPGLSNPRIMEGSLSVARLVLQRTGLQHLIRSSGILKPFPALDRLERFLPPIPARTVRQLLPEVVPAVGEKRGRVGFFLGCAMNTLFADVTVHSIQALTRLGFDVVIPREVVCCGAPQVSLGEIDLARKMARHNAGCFEGLDTIVTDCAACGAELKHYDLLLEDSSLEAFTSRVKDFAEFVEPRVRPGLSRDIGPVTYHAPCHLAHAQGVCRQPKALLRRLCEDFRELNEHDMCCGSAGLYWLSNPEIADALLARKLQHIRESGAKTVVTANPGCMLQLAAGRGKDDGWTIAHISEIVDAALSV